MEDGKMVREIGADGIVYLGVAKSMKQGDNRVAVPPQYVSTLKPAAWNNGRDRTKLEVLVEEGAGLRVGYDDDAYVRAGAQIVTKSELLDRSHILVDVKQRPEEGVLQDGINIFYLHVEKGQGIPQLNALVQRGGVTAYSPETIWVPERENPQNLVRGVNLAYYSGIGGAHLALEGIKLSYQSRGITPVPFEFLPQIDGATQEQMNEAYKQIGDLEKSMRIAIIGGPRGMVSSGAQDELKKAGLSPDLIYKNVTSNQETLASVIGQYDAIINGSLWIPGQPRMITKRQILAVKEGAVFMDDTCDPDFSSTQETEGEPIRGGVRYSFESKWGDKNMHYWVGPETHTFDAENPREFLPGEVRVLYNAVGMIPGGTTTACAASEAYFGMIFPYLTSIIRAVSQGTELPEQGLVVKDGKIIHKGNGITEKVGLRDLVQTRDDLAQFRKYL